MSTLHAKLKLPLKRVELQIDHRGMGYIHNADDDEISAYGSFNLTEEENREFGKLIATAVTAHEALLLSVQFEHAHQRGEIEEMIELGWSPEGFETGKQYARRLREDALALARGDQ